MIRNPDTDKILSFWHMVLNFGSQFFIFFISSNTIIKKMVLLVLKWYYNGNGILLFKKHHKCYTYKLNKNLPHPHPFSSLAINDSHISRTVNHLDLGLVSSDSAPKNT